MGSLVSYHLESPVATVTMDDGKVNALSLAMLGELNGALDRAQADGAAVVLAGRPGVFSAGFDLKALRSGPETAAAMLRAGFELSARLLAFPAPVVIACTGHAIAMGVFLVLSGDHRVGAEGAFKITANEVAIGMTMPHAAIALCRQRLAPAHVHRALALSEVYTPQDAILAGFLDRVAPADEVAATARRVAAGAAALDRNAHAATKLRLQGPTLAAMRAAIEAGEVGFGGRGHEAAWSPAPVA